MSEAILTLNAGSSSIKFALFKASTALARIAVGQMENIGGAPHFVIRGVDGTVIFEKSWPSGAGLSHRDLLGPVLDWVEHHLGDAKLIACGHRIVHGGWLFTKPVQLDAAKLSSLVKFNPLAPLHEPNNLAAVQAVMALRPGLPQIGCFDTSFHTTMPERATRIALPKQLRDEGVRRYGFHGLSYEYIAGALHRLAPEIAEGKVVAAHLGGGASVCAMLNGKSIDTSMGFTGLDGLIMGTRCGAIDAGVLLYLMQPGGMSAEAVSELLYKQSGLLGMSGISSDMRVLLASQDKAAQQAVESFNYAAAQQIGARIVALQGLDGLVFTAGIGEHSPEIRAGICAHLAWLGIEIDAPLNARNATRINTAGSKIAVFVIPTDEEAMIAKHCLDNLA
ncbi:MAG: acetate kinase [Acidocella sp. 20-57-95]|nr:MAG: acetate kinase [Acidocella sp. 20-57-95]OYV60062.1 MAG: acetate kinase [Acidocella sp. 21-58-7]HQT63974.1 acetate/propionate family kinase [Acidocella sp.]HQU04265.1 acetate/propionate family kinase [Acidocella sp.]